VTTNTPQAKNIIFYDGTCGLCHWCVLFVIPRDTQGVNFLFAPLQGQSFAERIPIEQQADLPDSIVVLTPENEVLVMSEAVFYMLRQLGGFWKVVGTVFGIIPSFLSNLGYRFVACIRRRVFRQPDDLCPIVPEELKGRFLH